MARLALALRARWDLGLERTMVVVTARSLGFLAGRPSLWPGLGVRGPPWGAGVGTGDNGGNGGNGGFEAGGMASVTWWRLNGVFDEVDEGLVVAAVKLGVVPEL